MKTVQSRIVDSNERSHAFYHLRAELCRPLEVDLQLNSKSLTIEVDTGAAVLLVSQTTYRNLFMGQTLLPSSTQLHTYSGEALQVLDEMEVKVQYQKQQAQLPLLIMQGDGPSLFGQDWL